MNYVSIEGYYTGLLVPENKKNLGVTLEKSVVCLGWYLFTPLKKLITNKNLVEICAHIHFKACFVQISCRVKIWGLKGA